MAGTVQNIILGLGKFTIGDVEIALTRGGGAFKVTREVRNIEADGMKSAGEDMQVIDREEPVLSMNQLTILTSADFTKLYPALQSTAVTEGGTGVKITSTDDLVVRTEDYKSVKWQGITNKGKAVIIEIPKAINLEGIDWSMVDKNEIIQALNFTGVAPVGKKKADWSVTFLEKTA